MSCLENAGTGFGIPSGQVDEIVMALIDASYDKSSEVKDVISLALFDLGCKKTSLVLSSCNCYLVKHPKLATGHRIVILSSMEKIIREKIKEVDKDLALKIISLASSELTSSKEVMPEWQTAASGVLVALGDCFINEVMEDILKKFQPGVLPHFFVVQTLGSLSSANVFGMVPFLNVVLGTMLPMMGMVKQDNMKWVFSSALCKFSEAILDYVANSENSPDPSVKIEVFSSHIYSMFTVLFNTWLQTREAKLRLIILEAVGHMSHIIAVEHLEEQLPRLIQVYLTLYKRHQEPYHITQGLCLVLEAATKASEQLLAVHLDNLFTALFPQVCLPASPSNLKNHNELLRCFTVLAQPFSDRIVSFLLLKLEQTNEKVRIGALSILRHLINASGDNVNNKKDLILSGIKILYTDNNNKVKQVLSQTVISMAHHGYLQLNGGPALIDYIIKQCSVPPDNQMSLKNSPDCVTNDSLRKMCDNVFQLLSTTVEDVESILWPYILELTVIEAYTPSFITQCKAIYHISSKLYEEDSDDFQLDFKSEENIPKPAEIISRFMVMVGVSGQGHQRAVYSLKALLSIAPLFGEKLKSHLSESIPNLLSYIDSAADSEDGWSQKSWEDQTLKMLTRCLENAEPAWISELAEAMLNQITFYNSYSPEKNFLFKCIGIVLQKSNKKELIGKSLDDVFSSTRHEVQLEREGCAICFGLASASHIDSVLVKLDVFSKGKSEMNVKKSSSFLSFIKKPEIDDKTRATIVLCFGYVAMFAPADLIVSRLESSILKSLTSHMPTNMRDPSVRQNLIRAFELLGKSLSPEHLKINYVLAQRKELLSYIQNFMKNDQASHAQIDETRELSIRACTALIKLEPKLEDNDLQDLLQIALNGVMPLMGHGNGAQNAQMKEESYEDLLHHEKSVSSLFSALENLLNEIFLKDLSSNGLDTIFRRLYPFMLSQRRDYEREHSLGLTRKLLQVFLDSIEFSTGTNQQFTSCGSFLAKIVPRVADSSVIVRNHALSCIILILKIQLRFEGKPPSFEDESVTSLCSIYTQLENPDSTIYYNVLNEIGVVISGRLPNLYLYTFLMTLQEGLLDGQSDCSSGACVVFNRVIKSRGGELHSHIEALTMELQYKLTQLTHQQTRTGLLLIIRTLASHNLLTMMNTLLSYPLPLKTILCEIWQTFAKDSVLAANAVDHILELLSRSLPYEEKPSNIDKNLKIKIAQIQPIAATAALTELLKLEELKDLVLSQMPKLLAAVLTRVASCVGTIYIKPSREEIDKIHRTGRPAQETDIDPSKIAIECLHQLLVCSSSHDLSQKMQLQGVWSMLKEESTFADGVTLFARGLKENYGDYIPKLVSCLTPSVASIYDSHRVLVTAVFSELINCMTSGGGDSVLIDMLVNNLLARLVDSNHTVRRLCVRGLGNVSKSGTSQVLKYSTTVLSAMMAGMDDKCDPQSEITLEAMSGLTKILALIQETHIRPILINISLRIRPCFEHENYQVRAASIRLFGNLGRFGEGPSESPFLEQVHTNLTSLLLHLNDEEITVKNASKFSLRQLGTHLGSEPLNDMFQKHLLETTTLHYGEFMNDLSKILIKDFEEKINFYVMGTASLFRSKSDIIRGNSAMFVGFVLRNMPSNLYHLISKEHICNALILLLKDSSVQVKIKAAEALSQLHDF